LVEGDEEEGGEEIPLVGRNGQAVQFVDQGEEGVHGTGRVDA
jgi:hypothetical protein